VQGTDGNLYGTTSQGGVSNNGTVFKITPAGVLTTLHSFAGIDGRHPYGALIQGADGSFYGTTTSSTVGNGTVFKMTPEGTLTTLHSFAGSEGDHPRASLLQGTDETFYGTAFLGGASGYGTVFKITTAGMLTTLHSFDRIDGQLPDAGLVQGTDGNFYGTASGGGPLGGGVVFRLTPGPGPSPTVTGVSPASGPVSGGTVVTVSGTDFQPGATVSFGGTAATGVTYFSATTIYALTPVHAAGAVTATVRNPDLQTGALTNGYFYAPPPSGTKFFTLTLCRLVDTRSASAGEPALAANSTRTFALAGACGISAGAVSVAANLTVLSVSSGYIVLFPGNGVDPGTRNVSFRAFQTRAANAILYLATDGTGTVKVANVSAGTNELILDVSGYFQ
jgi:uncharacterized repeat protein (TIGR03803 family)